MAPARRRLSGVLINVGHGQNGFLTGALLGAALIQLDRRPVVAGILLGCIAYKPQFGLMIPLVLALATTIAFGAHVWQAFLASTRFTRIPAGTRFTAFLPGRGCGVHRFRSLMPCKR